MEYTRVQLAAVLRKAGYEVQNIHNMREHYSAEIRKLSDAKRDPKTPFQFLLFRKDKNPLDVIERLP